MSTKDTAKLYDAARAALARRGLDADAQTGIALFLGAAKAVNAALLAPHVLAPWTTMAYPFVHGQWFREVEFASLLARVTRWSPNPLVYAEGAALVAPIWREWSRIQATGAAFGAPGATCGALALGHALLARVRLAPVLPADIGELDPFVVAIRRIEQEGGRMIQTQIRLLKDGNAPAVVAGREKVVEDEQTIVDEAFARFLQWLAGDRDDWANVRASAAPHTDHVGTPRAHDAAARERGSRPPAASPAIVVPAQGESTLQ